MRSVPLEDINEKILDNTPLEQLVLADGGFWKRAKIDLVIATDVLSEIMLYGVEKSHPMGLLAQETELGWIISGHTNKPRVERRKLYCMLATAENFNDDMKKFIENACPRFL